MQKYSFREVDLETDLPAMVCLLSLAEPSPLAIEQVRQNWEPQEGEARLAIVALDEDGRVIGLTGVWREAWRQEGVYRLTLIVDPEMRRQGFGGQMLERAVSFVLEQGGTRLLSIVREDQPDGLRFAERRQFRIDRHTFVSRLDLSAFDERPFVDCLERFRAEGMRFLSLADFEPASEEYNRRLYELNRSTGLDNPGNNGYFPPYETFKENVLEASWFRAEGQILAVDGERWVGLAAVGLSSASQPAYNNFTGVERSYRGRGLATALKLLAIRYAQAHGERELWTNNDSMNAPMLAINRRLGYQPLPGKYSLVRDILFR